MTPPKHEWTRVRELLEHAMELDGQERERFLDAACADDAALRAELEGLLEQDTPDGVLQLPHPAELAGALEEGAARMRLGPYELERLIGSGGMGSVWLARRVGGGFDQRVAIKLIKRGMDTEEVLRRFTQERAVLAGLEHPNIARLYDGGSSEDGRPFLVMEYVEGQALDRYCNARDSNLRERVELFTSICSAVEYAHRNLIVHRDLKPSNVLVTSSGTPKLLDFGIAKVLGSGGQERDEDRTQTAQRVLTPMYASPEQLRGEKLTTQCDVYSLGVVLYQLLSDTQPFDMARRPDSEPVPPSRAALRNPSSAARARLLEGDLDTIVLKAMSQDPARRYASTEHLADDLRRFLDGRPVLARPDTLTYRGAKFVRRNKLLVGASLAVAASVLAGLVVSTRLYLDASRARDKEQQQRLLASERLSSVLAIASSFTRDLDSRLGVLHGASAAREQLLRAAAVQLEKLAQQAPDDPGVELALGWVYRDLADTLGNPTTNNMGKYDEALVVYDKAIAVAEALFARDTIDGSYADFASSAFQARAELLRHYSRLDEARSDCERAAAIACEALPDATGNREAALIRKLCNALSTSATLERDVNRFDDALAFEDEMLAVLEGGVAKFHGDQDLRYTYAHALNTRGMGQYQRADYRAAVTSLGDAVKIFSELCAYDPDNTSYRRALARTQSNLANPLQILDDMEGATGFAHSALDSWEAIVRHEPDDEIAFYGLIEFANQVGCLEHYNQNSEAARAAYARAVEVEEKLIERHPQDTWRHSGHAMLSASLASVLSEQGKWLESFERAQRALDELDAIEHDPGRGTNWPYGRAMATTMFAECRINAARDVSLLPGERRAQLDGAQELLAHARTLLVGERDSGQLLVTQIAEIGLIDERVAKLQELRAQLPDDP